MSGALKSNTFDSLRLARSGDAMKNNHFTARICGALFALLAAALAGACGGNSIIYVVQQNDASTSSGSGSGSSGGAASGANAPTTGASGSSGAANGVSGASTGAGASGVSSASGVLAMDGSPPADDSGQPDATASGAADGTTTDAADARMPSDPCPMMPPPTMAAGDPPLVCDPKCGQAPNEYKYDSTKCPMATCPKGLLVVEHALSWDRPWIIRTPDSPGVDPLCMQQCPSWQFGFVLGFGISNSRQPLRIRVPPPWKVVVLPTYSQFCPLPDAGAASSCVEVGRVDVGEVFVVTDDPAAPARNVEFLISQTQPTCP
jgi:hypothetical protein